MDAVVEAKVLNSPHGSGRDVSPVQFSMKKHWTGLSSPTRGLIHLSHHVVGQYVSAFGFTSCAWDRILGTMSASYQTVPSSMARSFVQAIPYPLLPFFLESILFGQPGQGTDSTGASSKHQ